MAAHAPLRPAPLVVVSNRLPFQVTREGGVARITRAPGGLVTALEAALRERGGVWVGWAGGESPAGEPPHPPEMANVSFRSVPLSAREVTLYYGGFANRTLWPLFHYFVARTRIDGATWRAYQQANERFAAAALAAAESSGPDTLVWVHDYQLMLVPALLRARAPGRAIAYFQHIPFPAADVLRILPWSRALVSGLLGADLVGFQVPDHADHFLTCCERLLGCETDRAAGLVRHEGREIAVQAHPISIDAGHVEQMARAAPSRPARGRDAVAEIIGVDRLDYTKGIAERLLAVERLLELHPEWRRRVVFTQIVVPSRERVAEYQVLKREIDELVGRVNGRYSDRGWAPVRYLNRQIPPEELAAIYRSADVALVTPLRDGMNLVAKEFVAAQVDGRGVLVLSELAGAAAELPEALIVNPYDVEAMAGALHRALTMPVEERRARLAALRDRVRAADVVAWRTRYLAAAAAAAARRPPAPALLDEVRRRLAPWLAGRAEVALFLDYDGTLAPIAERPELARLGDEARRVLEAARQAPHLDVTIVSGRTLDDLRDMVGVEGLTYAGDHGYHIEGPGVTYRHDAGRWRAVLDRATRELEGLATDGAWVERKGAGVAFHVRAVPAPARAAAARRARTALRRRRLDVIEGKAVVEGRPPAEWNKGQAVLFLLERRHGAAWPAQVRALYAGDDTTDHDAFRALHGIGRSVLVGGTDARSGGADLRVGGPDDLVQLVRWLATLAPHAAT